MPESGVSVQIRQIYSTVTKTRSTDITTITQPFLFTLKVQVTSSNLWTSPYSLHQQELFDLICTKHDNDGLTFKQVSDWLNTNGYKSPQGKTFTPSITWSIYTKKHRSIRRFNREYPHHVTDVGIIPMDEPPTPPD